MITTTTIPDLPWHFSRNYQTINNGVPTWAFLFFVGILIATIVFLLVMLRVASTK